MTENFDDAIFRDVIKGNEKKETEKPAETTEKVVVEETKAVATQVEKHKSVVAKKETLEQKLLNQVTLLLRLRLVSMAWIFGVVIIPYWLLGKLFKVRQTPHIVVLVWVTQLMRDYLVAWLLMFIITQVLRMQAG